MKMLKLLGVVAGSAVRAVRNLVCKKSGIALVAGASMLGCLHLAQAALIGPVKIVSANLSTNNASVTVGATVNGNSIAGRIWQLELGSLSPTSTSNNQAAVTVAQGGITNTYSISFTSGYGQLTFPSTTNIFFDTFNQSVVIGITLTNNVTGGTFRVWGDAYSR